MTAHTSLSYQEIPFGEIAVGDVFVDDGWKDDHHWGQMVEAVFVHDDHEAVFDHPDHPTDPEVGNLISVRLTGHCGISMRASKIVGILR